MVALSASRLVCSAMRVMTLTTLPISAEDSPSRPSVALVGAAAVDGLAGHPGRARGVLGDLPDRRTHLFGAGRHGLHVPGHLLGGAGHDVRLRRLSVALVPTSAR